MVAHPDLQAEQAYIDHAYACLDATRQRALDLRKLSSIGPGGTHQARYESEIVEDTIRARLQQLHLGEDLALVFGRIDPEMSEDHWYIGRIAVSDEDQDVVVVDWRAPVAEPFYRATGRQPMGLARRRHFATRGPRLLDIEDELFGPEGGPDGGLVGSSALFAALEQRRTGRLGDIVATIQTEQDEIIRDELGGVVVVQGGPGTGKTVVALHRAAYLLYTHRFPLEGQGVLVVGPNRLYLRYIERVLPSLGEAGVELAMLSDLIPETVGEGRGGQLANRVKGDLRMVQVMAKAVRDRQRPLRKDLEVGFGLLKLRVTAEQTQGIVKQARRRARHHNAGRRFVEQALWDALAASAHAELEPHVVAARLKGDETIREALERMWPVLTPADLLRDLFGSMPLLRLAGANRLSELELASMHRERGEREALDGSWTLADVPLLDEARALLGPRPRTKDEDEERTYGHIVVDEAQDLSPMQLRMLSRRSLGGSMTVVGDIAQATGPWAPESWQEVLRHLPSRKGHRQRELSIGYRTPASIMTLANRVLAVAAPDLTPPTAVRAGDEEAAVLHVDDPSRLASTVAALAAAERDAVGEGNVAVIVPDSLVKPIGEALTAAGVDHGEAARVGIDAQVNLVPVRLVKGLELDSVIVVEPQAIVDDEPQGLRSLYVALTRATQRLAVVHAEELPEALAPAHVS
ncbi:MAG TPA: ATP-binding domain-containing protein [Acidimicrobiales bacterium]|nr:ATP-binding domain-containing protein [Acidimicrobiales bacterium]